MNILFTDVDGVLCTPKSVNSIRGATTDTFDPCACGLIRNICESTPDTKIVISSHRRIHFPHDKVAFWEGPLNPLLDQLDTNGLTEFLHADWRTKDFVTQPAGSSLFIGAVRGDEIEDWLDRHREVKDYLIIDDNEWILDYQRSHFLQTDDLEGFGFRDYLKVVNRWFPRG